MCVPCLCLMSVCVCLSLFFFVCMRACVFSLSSRCIQYFTHTCAQHMHVIVILKEFSSRMDHHTPHVLTLKVQCVRCQADMDYDIHNYVSVHV